MLATFAVLPVHAPCAFTDAAGAEVVEGTGADGAASEPAAAVLADFLRRTRRAI